MKKTTSATSAFLLCSMSSAMTVDMQGRNSQATEFIEAFLKDFVGDAYDDELQACFTRSVKGEIRAVQKALEKLEGGDDEEEQEFVQILIEWPGHLRECTDATNEKLDAFYEWAAGEDPQFIEGMFDQQLHEDLEDEDDEDDDTPGSALASDGSPKTCWKRTKGRGLGKLRRYCPPERPLMQAGLCYKECDEGFLGIGHICWQRCPEGFKNRVLWCAKPNSRKDECVNDMPDWGRWCRKRKRGRGVGRVPECGPDLVPHQGICYKPCPDGDWRGSGPVCWQRCPAGTHACGALCQAEGERCAGFIAGVILNILKFGISAMKGPAGIVGMATNTVGLAKKFKHPKCPM